jgi:hypothetical protein
MRMTLTASQADELRRSALALKNEAEVAVIRNREDIRSLEAQLAKARAASTGLAAASEQANKNYNKVLYAKAGTVVDYNLATGELLIAGVAKEPALREYVGNASWYIPGPDSEKQFTWQIKSRTGDKKYFVRWNKSLGRWTCECTSFAIRESCWHEAAVKGGVKKGWNNDLYVKDERGASHGVVRFVQA